MIRQLTTHTELSQARSLRSRLKQLASRRVATWSAGLIACTALQVAAADVTLPPISIGAGMRTSYTHDMPDGSKDSDNITLDSIRLYVNGSVTDKIKFTFNTEYTGAANTVQVMDSIARFELSDHLNIWAGRFLPPSDRANLYGPYYANDWNPYADGVADFYPNVAVGRDNGVAYWGQFSRVKVQAGVFDGKSLGTGSTDMLAAARVMVDLWDIESGYYLNGTYYGDKDLLAFGVAGQNQHGVNSYSVDGLMEKKLPVGGAFTVEAEYQKDDGLIADSKGYYVLMAYTTPKLGSGGMLEPLVKYSKKTYDHPVGPDTDVKTLEVNLNYLIKTFNARISLFYLNQKTEPTSVKDSKIGLGLQLQM